MTRWEGWGQDLFSYKCFGVSTECRQGQASNHVSQKSLEEIWRHPKNDTNNHRWQQSWPKFIGINMAVQTIESKPQAMDSKRSGGSVVAALCSHGHHRGHYMVEECVYMKAGCVFLKMWSEGYVLLSVCWADVFTDPNIYTQQGHHVMNNHFPQLAMMAVNGYLHIYFVHLNITEQTYLASELFFTKDYQLS